MTTPEETLSAGLVEVARVAAEDERARIHQRCLDLASQAGQRAKQAKKKGRTGVEERAEADAFRRIARELTRKPKAEKARKVTK